MKKIEEQSSEFSTELREIRAYFTFQMKDLNAKVDNGMTSVIAEFSKPVSPTRSPAEVDNGQIPVQDQTLRNDFEALKERFETLLETLQNPATEEVEEEVEEEETKQEEENENSQKEEENETNEKEDDVKARTIPETPKKEEPQTPPSEAITTPKAIETPLEQKSQLAASMVDFRQQENDRKEKALKKVYEMALTDLKIQVKNILERLKTLEDSQTTNAQLKASIDQLEADQLKLKADVLLTKTNLQMLNDSNGSKIAEAMKELNAKAPTPAAETKNMISKAELEKSIKEVRVEYSSQIATMQNIMNEEIKKLKREIEQMKAERQEIPIPVKEQVVEKEEKVEVQPEKAKEEEEKEEKEVVEEVKKTRTRARTRTCC